VLSVKLASGRHREKRVREVSPGGPIIRGSKEKVEKPYFHAMIYAAHFKGETRKEREEETVNRGRKEGSGVGNMKLLHG